MTPDTHARLVTGERVRVTVTLLDGSEVTSFEAHPLAVDRVHTNTITLLTDEHDEIVVPLEPVEATVLPLARPRPGGAA